MCGGSGGSKGGGGNTSLDTPQAIDRRLGEIDSEIAAIQKKDQELMRAGKGTLFYPGTPEKARYEALRKESQTLAKSLIKMIGA